MKIEEGANWVEGEMNPAQFAAWQTIVCRGSALSLYGEDEEEVVELREEIRKGFAILKGEYCDDYPSFIRADAVFLRPHDIILIGEDTSKRDIDMNAAKYWAFRWQKGDRVEYSSRSAYSRITFWNKGEGVGFQGVVSPQTVDNLKKALGEEDSAVPELR